MRRLRLLTAGESHGPAVSGVLEGLPYGLRVSTDQVNRDLRRRQHGYGSGRRMLIEKDEVVWMGGLRFGRTLGSPLAFRIENRDFENWQDRMTTDRVPSRGRPKAVTLARPGHADLAGAIKYGFDDVRNVLERASARETAARVAAGAVARAFLAELGIGVVSFTAEVGGVALDPANATRSVEETEGSALRCPDPGAEALMIARIDEARSRGDSVGGVFEVVATGVPIGLGSYVQWDRRLDAALAAAVMSINIVKGVEFGLGFEQTRRLGSEVHDVIAGRGDGGRWIHRSNNAGGLTGGVSNGEPIVVRGAVKPISTLARPLPSADLRTGDPVQTAHYERSDICVVPAAGVIGEAMVLLTLTAAVLEKFGGDSLVEVRDNLARYRTRTLATVRDLTGSAPQDAGSAETPGPDPAARLAEAAGGEAGSGGDD